MPPRRNRPPVPQTKQEQYSPFDQSNPSPSNDDPQLDLPRTRVTRNRTISYRDLEEPVQLPQDEEAEPEYKDSGLFLDPTVQVLLWRETSYEDQQERYLVKYFQRSYLHLEWKTKQELRAQGYEVTASVIKSTHNRMRKVVQLLGEGVRFNPNYKTVDRVLKSTEVFTFMHHKKANDVKGKWEESLVLVGEKLLNFVKGGYPYGVLFHQPNDEDLEHKYRIQNRTYIGQVYNRIYLGVFRQHEPFWYQLGIAIGNFLKIHPETDQDYFVVGRTILEAALFLYKQWHYLCTERFEQLKRDMEEAHAREANKSKGKGEENKEMMKEEAKEEMKDEMQEERKEPAEVMQEINDGQKKDLPSAELPQKPTLSSIKAEFCQKNILLTEKSADKPENERELYKLAPSPYTLNWLPQQAQPITEDYQFKWLTWEDCHRLDLNVDIEKLYYVKWCDLSYGAATWESEKYIEQAKIEHFRMYNKIPSRDIREKMDVHNQIHSALILNDPTKRKVTFNQKTLKLVNMLYMVDDRPQPKPYLESPIYRNYEQLKSFQLESLNWLVSNWHQQRNSILADEMGLGKTIQAIAFLWHLKQKENAIGPFLVIAPLSTLRQWRTLIERWTSFNCLLYYDEGRGKMREIIHEYEFYHWLTTKSGDILPSQIPKFQVLLTNYQLFLQDFQILKKIPYQHIILDEAHRLKNSTSKITMTLKRLPCSRKTLLTGTPIQNNAKQIWTLLNFIEPDVFPSQQKFLTQHGYLVTEEAVNGLKKTLKPYLLRRMKEDVDPSIPRLRETIIDVEMSRIQKAYYRGILEKNKTAMLQSLNSTNLNSISIQLRKCCNHPYLISKEAELEISKGSVSTQALVDSFIQASGKMILLTKLLAKFKKEGKKVLVFSQFVIMLELMRPYLEQIGYVCQTLIGSQSSTQRNHAISRFTQQDSKVDVFLISTKAGGVGINLIAATQIVIYDSDWNPQNDLQATARAHRIGQKEQVTVYRLITSKTYEAQMFKLASIKLGLDKAIFADDTFKSMNGTEDGEKKQPTKDEVETLLKKGVLGFLDNDVDEQEFFNQSIEDILQKNARKVEYSTTPNSCAFSKTKFKADDPNDVHIDAPDFWQKALKKVDNEVDRLCKKGGQLRKYSTTQQQQQLMLETYKVVFNLVKQKTQGNNMNFEDERNLLEFLQLVEKSRNFSRHLREIADKLAEEIIKPSRRFRVKEQDITEQQHSRASKLIKRSSTRLTRNSGFQNRSQASQSEAEAEPQPMSEVSEQQDEQSPSATPPKVQSPDQDIDLTDQDIQRLCAVCERPKCVIFCKGPCGRTFHEDCFLYQEGKSQDKPPSDRPKQKGLSIADWKEKVIKDQKCAECIEHSYRFKCSVCLEEGVYRPNDPKPKKKKKGDEKDFSNSKSRLYKCCITKCHHFFHLRCLFSNQFAGKFADPKGKTIKDVTQILKYFKCPAHYCFLCYGQNNKSTKYRAVNCIRCCKSFHDKCIDNVTHLRVKKDHYYICAEHLTKEESLQRLIQGIAAFQFATVSEELAKKRRFSPKKTTKTIQLPAKRVNREGEDKGLRRSTRIKGISIEQPAEHYPEQTGNMTKSNGRSHSRGEKSSKMEEEFPEPHKTEEKTMNEEKKATTEQIKPVYALQYPDFGLISIKVFDYSTFSEPWCRYCGSRYADSGFESSPWGERQLCVHHHTQWKRGKLRLEKYKREPKEPINRKKDNELKYLNEFAQKQGLQPFEVIQKLS